MKDESDLVLSPGEVVFEEGQSGDCMYLVREGEVEIRLGGEVLETVGPNSFFGEMAIIDQAPRSATAIAKTACTLTPINQKRFMFMVQQTPFFAIRLLKEMSNRVRVRNRKDRKD
jgi:CRP-like cAMP-binding protein